MKSRVWAELHGWLLLFALLVCLLLIFKNDILRFNHFCTESYAKLTKKLSNE